MSKAIEQQIEELYQRLQLLRAERNGLKKKAQIWADKRDRIHEEIRDLRLQIRSLRQRRDALNEEVKHLKSLREALLRRKREILEEISKLRQEKRGMNAEKPSRSRSYLEKEIERIEWKIQTEPLPLDVERQLIDQVKALEAQMEFYRRIEKINSKIADLKREADRLKADSLDYRSRIQEIAAQSQEFHLKMLKKIEDVRQLKAKADEMHQQYAEYRDKIKAIGLELKKILAEIRSLRDQLKEQEERERRQKEANLQKQTEEKALEKLRRGEKLTFDEFKILIEKGLI